MSVEEKKQHRLHYGYVIAAAMFLSYILSSFMSGTNPLFLAPVLEEFGCSRGQWGITTTIWMFGSGLVMPFLGKCYEKYDARIMQGICAVGVALVMAIRALSRNIYWWWASAVILAFVFPLVLNLMLPTFTNRWFVKRVGLVMSICSMAQGLSNTFFSTFMAVQIAQHGWRYAMWMQAILALVIGIPVALLFRSRPSDMGLEPIGYEEKAADSTAAKADYKPRGFTCKEAMATPVFWMLFAALALQTLAGTNTFVNAFLQTSAVGYTVVMAGAYVSAQSLGQTIGKLSMGTLSDIIGPKKVVLIGYTCVLTGTLGVAFLAGTVSPVIVSVFGFLIGFSMASGNLVWPLCAKEAFGTLEYSAIWANLVRALSMVGAFASTLWGLVIDLANGDYRVAFIGGSIMVLIPLTIVLTIGKASKDYPARWHE